MSARTETDRSAPSGEPFVRVPRRVNDALVDGDLSFAAFGVLVFVAGAANWRTRRLRTTLHELALALGWTRSRDYLGDVLRELDAAGWITYDGRRGSKFVEVTLTGALVGNVQKEAGSDESSGRPRGDLGAASECIAASDPELQEAIPTPAPTSIPNSSRPDSPLREPDSMTYSTGPIPTSMPNSSPRSQEVEVDVDVDLGPDSDAREHGSRASLDALPLDVRDALEGLVEEIGDGSVDEGTVSSYVAKFGDLPARAFDVAVERLLAARRRGKSIRSEAAWVSGLLSDIAADPRMYGIDW